MCEFRRDLAAPSATTRVPKIREAPYLETDLAALSHQLPPELLKQESAPSQKRLGSTVVLTVMGYLRSRNAQSRKGPWEMAD